MEGLKALRGEGREGLFIVTNSVWKLYDTKSSTSRERSEVKPTIH
jgi:hypothetical protein